jgi:hypothetical protein
MAEYINNHIHTVYSFSPYTPTEAVRRSVEAGLSVCGLMDHDSIAGAEEFIGAGKRYGIPVTVGMEMRVSMADTPFHDRRINNPDQRGVAYVALHAVPHRNIGYLNDYMAEYRTRRNVRNEEMCGRLTEFLDGRWERGEVRGVDFYKDVLPLSMYHKGGTVTERHIAYSLAKKLAMRYDRGKEIIGALATLGVNLNEKIAGYLSDRDNPYYEYDLLGVIKSSILPKIYVDADEELMSVEEFITLGKRVGAITAYAYLGDVKDSVTGDKADMEFEDSYLDELFSWLKGAGFEAVTYMPARNSTEQLRRVMEICRAKGLFEISGEDINSPRQDFVCRAYEKPEFKHLIEAAYSLCEK